MVPKRRLEFPRPYGHMSLNHSPTQVKPIKINVLVNVAIVWLQQFYFFQKTYLKKEVGAEEKTRTSTILRSHDPESCASTNSATSAHRA